MQAAQRATPSFYFTLPFWDRHTSTFLEVVFFYVFPVNVTEALTPSCLAPTLSPLSSEEPWLFLLSSLSKLNNHEEKNITCGKSTPFSFASHYPNSSLILYHYYPPTNDRVQAIVSLTTSLPKNNTTGAAIPPRGLALCICPWDAPDVWHF